MDPIVTGSIVLIAVCFLVLTIFLVRFTLSLQKSVTEIQTSVTSLAKNLEEVAVETKQLIKNTNELAEDLKNKSRAVDGLFESISEFSNSLKRLNQTIQGVGVRVQESFASTGQRISQIAQWGQVFMDLINRFRNRS